MTDQDSQYLDGLSLGEIAERVNEEFAFPGWAVVADHGSFALKPKEQPHIPAEVASEVLFYFGRPGYQPGSFVDALLKAFARADARNFAKLSIAFPDYGQAMALAQNDPNGIARLQAYANGNSR